MAEQVLIEAERISKSFGEQRVLDGVSFRVRRGETLVVLGRSGTGKSVLLKTLIGLMEPDGGHARVLGEELSTMTEAQRLVARRRIGYVFQGSALFDSLSVWENVGFPLIERRVDEAKVRERVANRLRMVGLEHVMEAMPASLSGGMRKRIALARALIDLPRVMLYDEPTTGLDPLTTDVINQIILRLRGALEVASVVVTHDMRSAFTIADRIIMLDQGRIISQGTPDEIRADTQPWVRRFIDGRALDSEAVDTTMISVGSRSGPFAAVQVSDAGGAAPSSPSVRMRAIRNRRKR